MITSVAEFRRLRESQEPQEYHRAAWEEAPLEVWHELIEHHPDMRFWVAHNKTVPHEILAVLANDADSHVRHMVASKNNLQAHLEVKFSKDPNESVRQVLVRKRKVSLEALQQLAQDENAEIRAIAREKIARRLP